MTDHRGIADQIVFSSIKPEELDRMRDLSDVDRMKIKQALQDYVDHPGKSENLKQRAREGIDYFGSDDND